MSISDLVAILERVRWRDGDMKVSVACTLEGIAGDPIIAIEDGEVVLDMDYHSRYKDSDKQVV